MGDDWRGATPDGESGIPRGGLVALGLPAGAFYFKGVALPQGGVRDMARFASGAIDSSLPVAVEDCLVYCSPQGTSLAVFAIEKARWPELRDAFSARAGRTCDALVPLPLASWDFAVAELARRQSTPRGLLLFLDASAGGWTLLAGHSPDGTALPLGGVMTVAEGDVAGVVRNGRLLAMRLAGREGNAGDVRVAYSGAAGAEAADALSKAFGCADPVAMGDGAGDPAALVARYASRHYFGDDFPPPEAESPSLRALRAIRAAAPYFVLAAAAVLLAISSGFALWRAHRDVARLDRQIAAMAAELAGTPLRQRGPAAAAAAKNLFHERADGIVGVFACDPPRDMLRTVFAFADTRSIDIVTIELDGAGASFDLCPKSGDDIAALAAALGNAGLAAEWDGGDAADDKAGALRGILRVRRGGIE